MDKEKPEAHGKIRRSNCVKGGGGGRGGERGGQGQCCRRKRKKPWNTIQPRRRGSIRPFDGLQRGKGGKGGLGGQGLREWGRGGGRGFCLPLTGPRKGKSGQRGIEKGIEKKNSRPKERKEGHCEWEGDGGGPEGVVDVGRPLAMGREKGGWKR